MFCFYVYVYLYVCIVCPYTNYNIYFMQGFLLNIGTAVSAAPQGYDLGAPSGAGHSTGGLPALEAGAVDVELSSGERVIIECRDGKVVLVLSPRLPEKYTNLTFLNKSRLFAHHPVFLLQQ